MKMEESPNVSVEERSRNSDRFRKIIQEREK